MKILLNILSVFYAAGAFIHKVLSRPRKPPLPVISVGNITAGGSGKTPLAAKIAAGLEVKTAIVLRGYRRKSRGVLETESDDFIRYGDEAVLHRRKNPSSVVIVAGNRYKGVIAAAKAGAEAVILDDGFQSLEVRKDINILVIDCGAPFGGKKLLPRGRLREPLTALSRADCFVLNRADSVSTGELKKIRHTVSNYKPEPLFFEASEKMSGYGKIHSDTVYPPDYLKGKKTLSFSGIGRPEAFRRLLISSGALLEDEVIRRDHHGWSVSELKRITRKAREKGCIPVTTEKDAARIPFSSGIDGLFLRMETVISDERKFYEYIRKVI